MPEPPNPWYAPLALCVRELAATLEDLRRQAPRLSPAEAYLAALTSCTREEARALLEDSAQLLGQVRLLIHVLQIVQSQPEDDRG